jgi:Domain of unknown function (DUF4397)
MALLLPRRIAMIFARDCGARFARSSRFAMIFARDCGARFARSSRFAMVATSIVAAIGLCLVNPAPAAAATGGGYVRMAHLVPDTIACDMYLQLHSVTGNVVKYLPGIKYGTVSEYVMVPAGTYAVAMRAPGAPASAKPVLSTSVTVLDGHAYTVARIGAPGNAQARVIEDDRTLPTDGKAKLRVVQTAQRTLNVSVAGGPVLATDVAFASATDYKGIDPGAKTLRVEATGVQPTTVQATVVAGSIYSLLVLEAPDGRISGVLLADAKREGAVPRGGVDTGAGGTARPNGPAVPVQVGMVLLVLVAGGLVAARTRLAGKRS